MQRYVLARERYYRLAVLFTFALGTAAGDLVGEQFGLGHMLAGAIFGGLILLITTGYYAKGIGSALAFGSAYMLTLPLGTSAGDSLTQAPKEGGLGFSTMTVCVVFLVIIVILVF